MAENGAQQGETQESQQSSPSSDSPEHSRMADKARETANWAAHSAAGMGQDAAKHYVQEPARDLWSLMRDYARDKPDVAALWCFVLGMVVGWKLKP